MVEAAPNNGEFKYCNKMKNCGHECDGIKGEPECIPCMSEECAAPSIVE